jgi:starvation-inducible outer membrane lipoprotein
MQMEVRLGTSMANSIELMGLLILVQREVRSGTSMVNVIELMGLLRFMQMEVRLGGSVVKTSPKKLRLGCWQGK